MVVNNSEAKICKTVQKIPFGKVACYGQVADLAGLPGRARMVGQALKNSLVNDSNQKLVPWHRVINSKGRISFPINSESFVCQKKLLQDEGIIVVGACINLNIFKWHPSLSDILFELEF